MFQILPVPSQGATEYTIEIDGQQLRYRNTPPQWANFVWPNPQGTPGAKVTATTFDGRTVELLNEPGRFGLERLIATAQRKRRPDGAFDLSWTKDGLTVAISLRTWSVHHLIARNNHKNKAQQSAQQNPSPDDQKKIAGAKLDQARTQEIMADVTGSDAKRQLEAISLVGQHKARAF